jgi:hypothetical protein
MYMWQVRRAERRGREKIEDRADFAPSAKRRRI